MKWRWKGTYIEAGEFGGGHEQIIIINRAGGTYTWMKVGNQAGWAQFVCAVVWHGQWGGGAVVVMVVLVVVAAAATIAAGTAIGTAAAAIAAAAAYKVGE